MSFADVAKGGYKTDIEPGEAAGLKIEQYQRQVQLIEGIVKRPSFKDDRELQDRVRYACVLQEEVAKALARMPNENALAKRKLCKDFDVISKDLEKSVKVISAREQARQEELVESSLSGEHEGETYEFRQLEDEIAHNEALIEEREEEIARVHQSVAQVNEIFKDLASIVQDQQSTIDDIESHIQESHARTQQGLEQVQKAAEAQSSCLVQ